VFPSVCNLCGLTRFGAKRQLFRTGRGAPKTVEMNSLERAVSDAIGGQETAGAINMRLLPMLECENYRFIQAWFYGCKLMEDITILRRKSNDLQ